MLSKHAVGKEVVWVLLNFNAQIGKPRGSRRLRCRRWRTLRKQSVMVPKHLLLLLSHKSFLHFKIQILYITLSILNIVFNKGSFIIIIRLN